MCHGESAALAAAETARRTFEEGGGGDDLPRIGITRTRLRKGVPLYELLRETGLAKSNGDARRLLDALALMRVEAPRLAPRLLDRDGARLADHRRGEQAQPCWEAERGERKQAQPC